jgi:hypothetical protein
VKITQYCSVCREELDMEVVPTGDGDDDGVMWLRCPRCQGFLPKISSSVSEGADDDPVASDAESPAATTDAVTSAEPSVDADRFPEDATPPKVDAKAKPRDGTAVTAEHERMLADMDVDLAIPYRPWDVYAIGDVIHHLAWDDCGIVVAKEALPGGRRIVKVYFEKTGIVRLIEGASPDS